MHLLLFFIFTIVIFYYIRSALGTKTYVHVASYFQFSCIFHTSLTALNFLTTTYFKFLASLFEAAKVIRYLAGVQPANLTSRFLFSIHTDANICAANRKGMLIEVRIRPGK